MLTIQQIFNRVLNDDNDAVRVVITGGENVLSAMHTEDSGDNLEVEEVEC